MDNITEIAEFARNLASSGSDDLALPQLTGLVAVVAVREYELLFKRILLTHAAKCHIHFSNFMDEFLNRLNGRILVSDLGDVLDKIARECKEKFVVEHSRLSQESIRTDGFDVVNAYNSVIRNRHSYVHKGNLTLTLNELVKYAPQGVRVFDCVTKALV